MYRMSSVNQKSHHLELEEFGIMEVSLLACLEVQSQKVSVALVVAVEKAHSCSAPEIWTGL